MGKLGYSPYSLACWPGSWNVLSNWLSHTRIESIRLVYIPTHPWDTHSPFNRDAGCNPVPKLIPRRRWDGNITESSMIHLGFSSTNFNWSSPFLAFIARVDFFSESQATRHRPTGVRDREVDQIRGHPEWVVVLLSVLTFASPANKTTENHWFISYRWSLLQMARDCLGFWLEGRGSCCPVNSLWCLIPLSPLKSSILASKCYNSRNSL